MIQTGLITYINGPSYSPPLWIILLYPLFSLLLNHSLNYLKSSYCISFLVGFAAAPLSYLAGVKMGGATFSYSLLLTWIGIGICWGLFLCLLIKLANVIEKATKETLAERDSEEPLKLLYDGECPLCNKEVSFLKKRKSNKGLSFVDIASKGYSSIQNQGLDYETAMSEIHAISGKGDLLIGVPAFSSVYARCQLPVLASFMRIPFIQVLLKPFYKLFAKNRLRITGRCKLPPGNNNK